MSKQIGGDHYVRCAIQPWEIIQRNELDFWEGNVVKYLLRHRMKDGLKDLYKAKHYLEYIIAREEEKEKLNVQTISQERKPAPLNPWHVQDLRSSAERDAQVPTPTPWGHMAL